MNEVPFIYECISYSESVPLDLSVAFEHFLLLDRWFYEVVIAGEDGGKQNSGKNQEGNAKRVSFAMHRESKRERSLTYFGALNRLNVKMIFNFSFAPTGLEYGVQIQSWGFTPC